MSNIRPLPSLASVDIFAASPAGESFFKTAIKRRKEAKE